METGFIVVILIIFAVDVVIGSTFIDWIIKSGK